ASLDSPNRRWRLALPGMVLPRRHGAPQSGLWLTAGHTATLRASSLSSFGIHAIEARLDLFVEVVVERVGRRNTLGAVPDVAATAAQVTELAGSRAGHDE